MSVEESGEDAKDLDRRSMRYVCQQTDEDDTKLTLSEPILRTPHFHELPHERENNQRQSL